MKRRVFGPTRRGRVNAGWLVFLGSAVVLGVLVLLLRPGARRIGGQGGEGVLVYCAAGVRAPVEQVAREYERLYGVPVQLSYGGSQTLLTSLEVSGVGDLYLPGDDSYVEVARQKGLAAEVIPLARMRVVVCVRKGNPAGIRTVADLLREGVVLGQANPEAAAIGRVARAALRRAGRWEVVEKKTKVFKGTVTEVANDVKLGAIDAGLVWDAVVMQYPELESVRLPELESAEAHLSVTVLSCSRHPTAALRFARYLSARDQGLEVFRQTGYEVVEGDLWSEQPELLFYSGAMLRPGIEQTLTDFEQREGVRLTRVYNGCGILVAQMKAGERPDAYFSCERSFFKQVDDLFTGVCDISQNRLVILVAKGNPRGIKTLSDLGGMKLRIGLGQELQSALGAITKSMLQSYGNYDAVRRNVAVESPTGDFLVNQLRTGSLDAVIVYRSNANTAQNQCEVIAIDLPSAQAIQPVGVGQASRHKHLAARLVESIKSAQSKERFLSAGFEWVLQPGAAPER